MSILFELNRETLLHYFLPVGAFLFSLIALVISIFGIYKTMKTEASAKRVGDRSRSAKHTAQQSIELTIASLISTNRIKMEEAEHALKLFKQQHPEQSDEFRKKIYVESIEEYLSTFEKAAALYLEGRFDKDRFIKDYKNDIRRIIEKEEFYSKYLDPAMIANKFRSLQKVYDKWENVEK